MKKIVALVLASGALLAIVSGAGFAFGIAATGRYILDHHLLE